MATDDAPPSSSRTSFAHPLPSYDELCSPTQTPHFEDPSLQHPFGHLNLPLGRFYLRNRGTGRVLDVRGGRSDVKAEVILYPPKDVRGSQLDDYRNNQLWFCDWNGGLYVDVVDGQLVLTGPTPIASQPTQQAHRPPIFRIDPVTAVLQVFQHIDETDEMETILEAVPTRATAVSPSASTSVVSGITSWFGRRESHSKALPPLPEATGPLRSPQLGFDPMAGDEDDDDPDEDSSSEPMRSIRTLSLASTWREKLPAAVIGAGPSTHSAAERLWRRRQWEAVPIFQAADASLPHPRTYEGRPVPPIPSQLSPIATTPDIAPPVADLVPTPLVATPLDADAHELTVEESELETVDEEDEAPTASIQVEPEVEPVVDAESVKPAEDKRQSDDFVDAERGTDELETKLENVELKD